MKKIVSVALCALMAASMAVSTFADDSYATISNLNCLDYQENLDEYAPGNGIDGNMDTRISIEIDSNDGEYVIAELDKLYSVTGISVAWFNGHTRFYDIEVYVSADGKNWTVAAERAGTEVAEVAKGFSDLAFDKAYDAKYVKIHCWGKTDTADGIYDGGPNEDGDAQSWLTFWEMKVLGTAATSTPLETAATTAPATMDVSVLLAGVAAASAAVTAVIRKKK